MRKSSKRSEPLLHPPLAPELEARLRKAGHGHWVEALRDVKASTIKGLMKAIESSPLVSARSSKKAARGFCWIRACAFIYSGAAHRTWSA